MGQGYNLHSFVSIASGFANVKTEPVQARKQIGEMPTANWSDYRQSPSSLPEKTPANSYPERLLLKLMKQLKKQKQLMKAKNWAPEKTLMNLSPLLHHYAPLFWGHSPILPFCSHLSGASIRTGFLPDDL